MEGAPGIALIIGLLVLIYAIVTFLLPFFVLRIRNEMISMNKKMTQIVHALGGEDVEVVDPAYHQRYQCGICGKNYSSIDNLKTHIRTSHKLSGGDIDENIKEL